MKVDLLWIFQTERRSNAFSDLKSIAKLVSLGPMIRTIIWPMNTIH